MRLDAIYRRIEYIEQQRNEDIASLLQLEIQIEFDKVRKRRPEFKEILFGNGTYVIRGYNEEPWKQTGMRQVNLAEWRAEYKLTCPRYMKKLIKLCETANEYGLYDVKPAKGTA